MADPASGIDWSSILGGGASLAGLGMSAGAQGQQIGILQNALNTIGPTQLQGYNISGPGGMSTGYNKTGAGSISLGALNPAFAGLIGGANGGIGNYSPALLQALTGSAGGTTGQALGTLNSAYGGNSAFQNLALGQASGLNQTYGDIYNNTLANLRAQAAPQIQQQAYGLQNTLFGNGVGDSTGAASGSLMAQNFGRGIAQADASNQLAAQQAALQGMQTQAGIAGSLSNTGNSLLSNAFANFGNTNQLVSGLNTASLNNSLSALQGAGALNTLGLNNYMAALQTGSAQANARNLSLFPYAGTAAALAGTPTVQGMLGSGLGQIGQSLLGANGGLGGLVNGIGGLVGRLFGGGGGTASSNGGGNNDPYAGFDTSGLGTLSGLNGFGTGNTVDSSGFNNLNSGFNSSDYSGSPGF
jgi:hypothetical protein